MLSKSVHGGKWLVLSTAVQKVVSLATFLFLARWLTPADYGTIAVLLMVTAAVERFTSHGLGTALAQKGGDLEPYLDTVWTINVFRSFVVAAILVAIARPLSVFFNIPDAAEMMRWGGLFIIISSVGNIRQLYFFTRMDFKKVFWREVSGQIGYAVTAIGYVLFVGASFWALFFGHVARFAAAAIASYWLYPHLPRFAFRFKQLAPFVNYSKWVVGQNMFDYFLGMLDQLFVGRLLGPVSLGYYAKARDLSSLTTSSLLSIIRKVGFFAYANLQADRSKIQEGFIKSLDVVLLVTLPFSLLLIVEGGTIVSFILGAQWLGLVPPLKILAVANIFRAIAGLVYPLFNSIGRPELNFKATLLQLVISLPLFYVGIQWGQSFGAAVAFLATSFALLLYAVWQARSVLSFGWQAIMPTLQYVVALNGPLALIAIVFRPLIHSFNNEAVVIAWIGFLSLLYVILFFVVGSFLSRGPGKTAMQLWSELKTNWRQ